MPNSIAIDGPAGAGKSTLSRRLAKELGFAYIDTGALYRSIGLFAFEAGLYDLSEENLGVLLQTLDLRAKADEGMLQLFIGSRDVSEAIRDNEISKMASRVSAFEVVRSFLLDRQRVYAREMDVVMDGRDIGTVVLPKAELKIFLTASLPARAKRRWLELREKGGTVTYEQVLAEMEMRDAADSARTLAPLRRAPDAHLLDTSHMSYDESYDALYELAKERFSL